LPNIKEGALGLKKSNTLKNTKVVGFDKAVPKDAPTKDK
jgi:hypothetical protein